MNLKTSVYFLFAIIILVGGWYLLDLPPEEELRAMITSAFDTYGPLIIIVGAFIEAILLVGMYFPGSLIIFLSVALSASIADASLAVMYVTIGLYSGYLTDFILGKYGWYKLLVKFGLQKQINNSKTKIQNKGLKYIFLTFWNPAFSALTSTAAGVLQIPFRQFAVAALGAVILWNIFWGVLVYSLGEAALTIVGFKFIIFMAVAWVMYEILKTFWIRYKTKST